MEIINDNKKEEEQIKILLTILYNINNVNSEKERQSIYKDNYEFIFNYINKNKDDENLILLIDYLNDIELPIIRTLIEGYVIFDFEEENQNKLNLEILAKVIKIYFNKNLFKCVYRILSKFFLQNQLLKDIQQIKRFEKIFNVWKLLYNIDNNEI